MSSELLVCPECAGQQLGVHDVRGILAIQHRASCSLGLADDATRHSDYLNAQTCPRYKRPMTATEYAILTAWASDLPIWKDSLKTPSWTVVDYPARDWPHLWQHPVKRVNLASLPTIGHLTVVESN